MGHGADDADSSPGPAGVHRDDDEHPAEVGALVSLLLPRGSVKARQSDGVVFFGLFEGAPRGPLRPALPEDGDRQRSFTNFTATSRSAPLRSAITACRSSRLLLDTRSSSPSICALTAFGPCSRMIFEIFFAFSWSRPSVREASIRYSLPRASGRPRRAP